MPLALENVNRALYFFKGRDITIGEESISVDHTFALQADKEVTIENGPQESHFLFLQGRPIGEPVVQHGPFVMKYSRGDQPNHARLSEDAIWRMALAYQ